MALRCAEGKRLKRNVGTGGSGCEGAVEQPGVAEVRAACLQVGDAVGQLRAARARPAADFVRPFARRGLETMIVSWRLEPVEIN